MVGRMKEGGNEDRDSKFRGKRREGWMEDGS